MKVRNSVGEGDSMREGNSMGERDSMRGAKGKNNEEEEFNKGRE